MNDISKGLIGIVGGMGPYAGIDLAKKIHDQTEATTDQQHLPVILASMPHAIPDRTTFLKGETDLNPAVPIAEILHRLEAVGGVVAGMPCVTAHSAPIWDEIQARQAGRRIRLISIIDATLDYIREVCPEVQSIAAFSTTATFRGRLFLDALAAAGFTVVKQDDVVQETHINDTIFNKEYGIKAHSNPVTARARRQLTDALAHVRGKGAKAVILGCTELPLALPEPALNGLTLIDPTLALARALVKAVAPDKLRPSPLHALDLT